MDDDQVFKALADPTRRHLLDRLFERDGRTLTELESELEMTRFGVMKHLRVLEDAGLVVTRREGREKLHFLNPVPIRLVHDRWIDKYTEHRVAALADLKHELEDSGMTTMTALTTQVYSVFIRATPEQVWDAITKPEFTQQYFFGAASRCATAAASRRSATRSGTRKCSKKTRRTSSCTAGSRPTTPRWRRRRRAAATWEIEPHDGGITRLTVVHDQLEGAPKTAESVAGGWMYVLSGLKTLLETGKPLAG